jgi:oligopeptide/dipeptide ABC transporter ATP-binding protein
MSALLDVNDLTVSLSHRGTNVRPIEGVTFSVKQGERVGIVGESGSGKTTLGMALLRLLPQSRGMSVTGSVRFDGDDVLAMSARALARYRGQGVAAIFQDPMTSLNPTMRVGAQVGEPVAPAKRDAAVLEALRSVGIPDAERRARAWPHHLSGGMRQRVVGAVGLAGAPRLLIADEPTTSLDVTVQLQVIDLLEGLSRERGMALMLITHDLTLVARACERIIVMYAGQIVEDGPAADILAHPKHWYTAGLIDCARSVETAAQRFSAIPGAPPLLTDRPTGCRFQPRCPRAEAKCAEPPPVIGDAHAARCWFPKGAP